MTHSSCYVIFRDKLKVISLSQFRKAIYSKLNKKKSFYNRKARLYKVSINLPCADTYVEVGGARKFGALIVSWALCFLGCLY